MSAAAPTPPRAPFAAGLALTVVAALALRLPRLASVPNAAHDEGNWLLAAWERAHGRALPLAPDARFVTDLFAWLLSVALRLGGATVASARSVPVVASVVGLVAVALVARRVAGARAALVLAALLAVHPWAVLWSRNVVTPYALSFALAALCPLVAHRAWALPSPRPLAWRVACGQLVALGFHFSPLALLTGVGVAAQLAADPTARARLRDRSTALAVALAALHVAPIALGAARVAHHGTTRPSAHFDHLGLRLWVFARTLAGVLSGESTVRDFTTATLPPALEFAAGALAVGLVVFACVRGSDPLRRVAVPHLLVALIGLPLMLAPMRQWHMPSVDAERYGFALLAPAALLVASLAATRWRALAAAAVLALAL
ncbi:MAG: Dolichyl-phosphate-mannose-protein mannosyltransferase, partial [Myxococcaceae bacterium]|nr:Dolichyl-phosphate-mannose-protein mannosyltransferase [Myxococcaceae bacterium]